MIQIIQQDTAHFDGKLLSGVRYYDYPKPHNTEPKLELVSMEDESAHYWSACNGVAQAWRAVTPGITCIALVDSMLREITGKPAYVIWKPRIVTSAVIRNWTAKWTKRNN